MMNISYLPDATGLNGVPKHRLAFAPWKEYPYHPEVSFAIGYGDDAIFLQYTVQEKHLRAVNSTPNSPVWEDSCVEFFIAFDDDEAYYNIEVNCIGAALIGYGEGRQNRESLPAKDISFQTTITRKEEFHWQLTLAIPFKVFQHHQISSLKGRSARANFYKCGDLLPEPHFISWSNIDWPEPNFHLIQFFKKIQFTN